MNFDTFLELTDRKFALSSGHGESKVLCLEEAIRRFVRPNQTIHLGFCGGFSMGAVQEITRQFYDKKPNFHLAWQQPFILLLLLTLLALSRSGRRADFTDLALLAVWTIMALLAGRNIAIFALVVDKDTVSLNTMGEPREL